MARIAILDDRLPEQIKENPSEFDGIEVVWSGTNVEELERKSAMLRPAVLVVNLDHLPPGDYKKEHARLLEKTRAELIVALYTFAKRADIDAISGEKTRTVKAPVSLGRLRAQMISVLIKDMFQDGAAPSRRDTVADKSEARPASPSSGPPVRRPVQVAERQFNDAQLARLMEIKSVVDCECPNHLSELVMSLAAFEKYSAQCQDKDDKDADMHALLHEETAKARRVMEDALAKLVKHEGVLL